MTISRAFTTLAAREPDALAVDDGVSRLTRGELERRSNALAGRLRRDGVTTDALVTIIGGNTVDTVTAIVAAWKAGATPQPVSPRSSTAERRDLLDRVRPALVVSAEPVPGHRWLPLATAGAVGDEDTAPLPDRAAASWKAPTSSGSTGTPKVVLAAASAHVDPDSPVAAFIPRSAVQLVAGPLTHAAPFVYAMRGLTTGHGLILLPRFDPVAWLDAVEEHRVTWAPVVPVMMSRIAGLGAGRLAAADVSSLDAVLHLGAVCPDHVKRAWIDWLGPERVVEVYAGTEANGLTMIRGDEWLHHPGSVGRPVGGTRLRIVDPDGTPVATGATGRIEMTRPGAATYRYLGADRPPDDAWHSLGDHGHLDDDGYLHLADRGTDRIVSDGVEIWPAAVESALERHPAVRSCLVVGRPDPVRGQRVHAVVDIGDPPGRGVAVDDLDAWVATQLPAHHRPHSWLLVHAPLRDDTGKARRRDWR